MKSKISNYPDPTKKFPGSKIIRFGLFKKGVLPWFLLHCPEKGAVVIKGRTSRRGMVWTEMLNGVSLFSNIREDLETSRFMGVPHNMMNINYLEAVWVQYKKGFNDE